VARSARVLRWTLRIALVLLVADLAYLAIIWPDWKTLAAGPIPKSSFMQIYEDKAARRDWGRLVWQPVPLTRIPRHMQRAVIVAEDSRFYEHSGFDLIAIKDAIDYNLERGELAFGASTISQQTVKNLYLSPSRNPLRKWHELFLTGGIESNLSKGRILEIYLNIAEFGRGLYGVQAAAQHYYGVDVEQLTPLQAAELAATLPSPVKRNPAIRTELFQRRTQRIHNLMTRDPAAQAAVAAVQALPVADLPPPAPAEEAAAPEPLDAPAASPAEPPTAGL
jgi:monofunctional biosynthetic peptidoglycan transglycosylase